jgi:type IV pilus assembly protein PilE
MKRYRRAGFTLIDIMLALAVLAILASIAYPSYVESVRKVRRAEGRAALMQLMQQQEQFYSQHTRYIAFSATTQDTLALNFKWYSGASANVSAYEIKGEACEGDTIDNCVLLTAMPGTGNVNSSHTDIACGHLMLASSGVKTASGKSGNCW